MHIKFDPNSALIKTQKFYFKSHVKLKNDFFWVHLDSLDYFYNQVGTIQQWQY